MPEIKRLDVGALVEELVADVRPACCIGNLGLALDRPEGRLEVDADPQRLSQAINNLLHNACQFTGPGGDIHGSVMREGDEAVIRVKDTGIGMSPELLPAVFDMSMFGAQNSIQSVKPIRMASGIRCLLTCAGLLATATAMDNQAHLRHAQQHQPGASRNTGDLRMNHSNGR